MDRPGTGRATEEAINGFTENAINHADEDAGNESWRMQRELMAWYAGVFIIVAYAAGIVSAFIGNADTLGVVTSFVAAALVCGEIYYRRTQKVPTSFFAWWMAGLFTITNAAISVISLFALLHTSHQALPDRSFWQGQAIVMAAIFVGSRFLFRAGASRLKKVADKKAHLGAPRPTEDVLELAELEGLLIS